MVGLYHCLSGYEFEQTLGIDDGQGSLGCCSPWSRKELDMTEPSKWTELNHLMNSCLFLKIQLSHNFTVKTSFFLSVTSNFQTQSAIQAVFFLWAYCLLMGKAFLGFPGGTSGKEPAWQWRTHKTCGFDPWVGKIPWRRAWPPTSVFLPGEFHEQRSLAGCNPYDCKE